MTLLLSWRERAWPLLLTPCILRTTHGFYSLACSSSCEDSLAYFAKNSLIQMYSNEEKNRKNVKCRLSCIRKNVIIFLFLLL